MEYIELSLQFIIAEITVSKLFLNEIFMKLNIRAKCGINSLEVLIVERIESVANKKIKFVASLKQKKHRDKEREFVAEGVRLVEMAVESDRPFSFALYTKEAMENVRVRKILRLLEEKGCTIYEISADIYRKVSDTVEPQGIMLVLKKSLVSLDSLVSSEIMPLILVLDGLQDPGNVGTIIRTADAAGCTGIVLMKNTVDVFSGKTVRAAMGSLFHLPVVIDVSVDELKGFLGEQNIVLQATALDSEAKKHFDVDFTKPTAIAFGNEGDGISKELLSAAEQKIYIPMIGQTESLNVSTAAAVVLYEAARQRMFYKQ